MNDPNPDLPDYVKPPYSFIKKKPPYEDEAGLYTRFSEILTKLQVNISFHEVLEVMSKFSKFMSEKCDTTLL